MFKVLRGIDSEIMSIDHFFKKLIEKGKEKIEWQIEDCFCSTEILFFFFFEDRTIR